MTYQLHHIYIKKELIQTFAMVDEWIDYAHDHRSSNPQLNENLINFLSTVTKETHVLLSSIKDYRYFTHQERGDEYLYHPKSVHILFANAQRVLHQEEIVLTDLRSTLREQLLECLLLLELPDENKGCDLVLHLGELINIDVLLFCKAISDQYKQVLNELGANRKNMAL